MTRSIWRYAFVFASSLVVALLASGQQVVTSGPPPEVRNHIEALVKALNSGGSDEWEKMAQEHFSPGELKRQSVQERKQVFDNLRHDFGTISLGRVEGPDEPLRLHLKGSTGASGVSSIGRSSKSTWKTKAQTLNIGSTEYTW